MSKLLTLLALSAFLYQVCYAQTSTTEVKKVSEKSFVERLSGYYYMDLNKAVVSKEDKDVPNSYWLSYINAGYQISEDTSISTTFRFQIIDTVDRDRFDELDQRIGISSNLYSDDKYTFSAMLTIELPTSRGSQADHRQMRLKPAIALNTKFDDYNNLYAFIGYNKTLYPNANQDVGSTSRHYYTPWIVYTNQYLSDKYVFKAAYSSSISHIPGTSDLNVKKDANDTLNIGTEFTVADISLNPYIMHDLSLVKSINTLGAGFQLFKSF